MLTVLKTKETIPTFIPNPEGQLSKSKTAEKLRKAHAKWQKAQKARKEFKTSEAYWSKMCTTRSF